MLVRAKTGRGRRHAPVGTVQATIGCAVLALLLAAASAAAQQNVPARGTIEVAFSPADDPEALIIKLIRSARSSLRVHAYVFTSQPIAAALIEAQRRGVKVEVLADAKMNGRGSGKAMPRLLEAGVPLAFETEYAAAHNKVIIADAEGPGCAVLTGSYNFTWSARNRNAENVIVLRDNCPLAQLYLENWQRHRAAAVPVTRLPFGG